MVRGDLTFWVEVFGKTIEFDERVTKYVDSAGLGGILRCGYRKLDRALIKALIERCRPETNTFHLPFGEVTVTLQDVNVLWGLPIEGDALLGIETSYDVDGLSFINRETVQMRDMGPEHYQQNFEQIQGMTVQIVRAVNHEEILEDPLYIQTQPINLETDNAQPQRVRHRNRGRGHVRRTERLIVPPVHHDVRQTGTENYGEGP
ncbi:hypothetical protein QVD17_38178 [Tagetes erecta]|uniref:Aminotransferase-like plant mobile domain-containing protein n=1 Tax=Tagetes erecta TaxID=13708 RepID=A0AAD8JW18_TARER|nr:hypothetical protein QVD17_38178 [Tagetes erecta]